jgi:hypothetical protein
VKPEELPTAEMPALGYPPRAERRCGYCKIPTAAVHAPPIPYRRPGATVIEYFHHGCIARQRTIDAGIAS